MKLLNDRLEVVRCLGSGSTGTVYLCRNREAGHQVAVKILFPDLARDESAVTRVRNEVVAGYEVAHPNVVRMYEYFREGENICFTMEYIDGGNLSQEMADNHPLDCRRVVQLLVDICSGLEAVHATGIIHRDLKPENILLTKDGTAKISDFSIAQSPTIEPGGVVGTMDYIAPEYLQSGSVDQRGDIYAVGVIAYELLTDQPPYKEATVIATMTKRLEEDPVPPSELNPRCPPSLSELTISALSRDPAKRPQSAKQMVEMLQRIARNDLVH